jgi:hypothetical protein
MSNTSQLLVDLGALKDLGTELIVSANSLSGLEDVTASLAGEVGHPGLAQHVDEFSKSWGHKRERLNENVKALADQVFAVVEELMKTDKDLKRALTQPATTA